MSLPTTLLWCDLETSGLDPQRATILEVALIATPFDDPFFERVQTMLIGLLDISSGNGAMSRA